MQQPTFYALFHVIECRGDDSSPTGGQWPPLLILSFFFYAFPYSY